MDIIITIIKEALLLSFWSLVCFVASRLSGNNLPS